MSANPLCVVLVLAGEVATVCVFGLSLIDKMMDPRTAIEVVGGVSGSYWIGILVVSSGCALEAWLVGAICLGFLRGQRAIVCGAMIALVLLSWLVWVRSEVGGAARCGCLSVLGESSVDHSLCMNTVFVCELGGILILLRVLRENRCEGTGIHSVGGSGP